MKFSVYIFVLCTFLRVRSESQDSINDTRNSGSENFEDLRSTSVDFPKTSEVIDKNHLGFKEPNFNKLGSQRTDFQGICEIYTGEVCADYVKNQSIYLPHPLTQKGLEEKLNQAFRVINFSTEISKNCEGYAKPSLCFSSFPICRDPVKSQKATISIDLFNRLSTNNGDFSNNEQDNDDADDLLRSSIDYPIRPRRHSPQEYVPKDHNRRIIAQTYGNVRPGYKNDLNNRLRRICREECEMLENELCRKEYAIAKRHPQIGLQVPLVECSDLPEHDHDCLSLGIPTVNDANESDDCYEGSGVSYRGTVMFSETGKPCMRWSHQMQFHISDYSELAKNSYCRNPGGKEVRPWCYVDSINGMKKEFCIIRPCFTRAWMYTVVALVFFGGLAIIIMCYCYCHQNRKLLRQPNYLPSNKMMATVECDENIYDGKCGNVQPVEMSLLLAGSSNHNTLSGTLKSKCSTISRNSENPRVPRYTIDKVVFFEELGEGAFGKVFRGELKIPGKCKEKIFVAVKTLKENASVKTQNDFRREVDLMTDLKHPNIICLLGVVLTGEPMCMLFEYMTQGDLHEFLIRHSPRSGTLTKNEKNKILKQPEFFHISVQVASGMEYLAGNHYVHRDLAARNCLVGDNLTVKISDFGLSRDIYSSDYYRVQSKSLLPVRWMPPEAILYGKCTTESDVWSFGVVLWEIFSYGLQPYYGYNNQEVIDMIRSRQLLPCPEDCPATVYALMTECWHEVAGARPQFPELHNQLHNLYVNLNPNEQGQNLETKPSSPVIMKLKNQELKDNLEKTNLNMNTQDKKKYCSTKLSSSAPLNESNDSNDR